MEIKGTSGAWHQETTHCDGADPATRDAATCTIPQAVLTATNGNFKLARGDLVEARVAAANQLGTGDASPVNAVGARIQTVPGVPQGLSSGTGTGST